jgi:hypothetical protein
MELQEILSDIKKHWKLFLSVFFIFILAALWRSYSSRPYYHFEFLIKTPNLIEYEKTPLVSDVELRMLAKELETYRRIKNYELIAGRMGVSKDMFDNIKSMQSNFVQSKDKSNILEFAINVYDTTRTEEIRRGILNFLNNNEYVKEKLNSEREKLTSLKNNFQTEIGKMGEPASLLAANSRDSVTNLLKNAFARNLIAEKTKLMAEIYLINVRLEDLQGFKIIQQPSIAQRVEPRMLRNIIIAGFLSFMVSVFIVLLLKFIRASR